MAGAAAGEPRARKGKANPAHVAKSWHFRDLDSVCSGVILTVRSDAHMAHRSLNLPHPLAASPGLSR